MNIAPRFAMAITVLAVLGACEPKPAPIPQSAAPARPAAPEFADCGWGEVKSVHLSIWSFNCGQSGHGPYLTADAALPGFYLEDGASPLSRRLVIRTFAKPPQAGIEAILPALRAASPGPDTASCTLVASTLEGATGQFAFEPTGEAKAAWDKQQETGGEAPPPCGAYGVDFARTPYFQTMPGHPDTVVYADMGSEIQIFDPATLRKLD